VLTASITRAIVLQRHDAITQKTIIFIFAVETPKSHKISCPPPYTVEYEDKRKNGGKASCIVEHWQYMEFNG
jgi:hypothetical protein